MTARRSVVASRLCAVALAWLVLAPGARAQVDPDNISRNPVPGPTGSATAKRPMVWVFTQATKNGLEKKTVTIKDLPRREARPPNQIPESAQEAIERKARVLVDAFNKELGAGRAKVEGEKGKPQFVVVNGLAAGKDKNGKLIETVTLKDDPTGQRGNGGQLFKGSGGKMSLGGSIGNTTGVDLAATGFDEEGSPSVVEFGVAGLYVASLMPGPGTSDLSILAMLGAELAAHGVASAFDPASRTLTIDPVHDSDRFSIWWTSTDPGLPFSGSVFAVPEPQTGWLLAAGLGMVALRRRAHRGPRRSRQGRPAPPL